MAEQKYVSFIEGVFQKTKEGKLSWRYLDSNRSLYEGMGWTNVRTKSDLFAGSKEVITPDFDMEDSFYVTVGNMYIVIYVWGNQPAKLYVVPNTYKKVIALSPDEYGEYITRLLNLVQSQFPNAETFIEEFVNKTRIEE